MLVPVGENISIPVVAVCPSAKPHIHNEGRLVLYEGDRCIIEVTKPVTIPDSAQVIVSLALNGGTFLTTRLVSAAEQRLTLEIRRVSRRDKRGYPRQDGGLQIRYKDCGTDQLKRSFMAGLTEVTDPTPWAEPKPFMNFSGSGLRFHASERARVEDTLLIEFRLPDKDRDYRCVGKVVRVDEDNMLAVRFADIPIEATNALTRFTLECQLRAIEAKQASEE